MGPKSPSRQLQPSHSQDLGGPAGHVPSPMPIACMRGLEAFQWAGGRSDPHVSKPAFGVDSNGFCFQDLNRPSSRSKSDFLAWAAQTGQKKADFRGAIAQKRHEPSPIFMGGFDSYRSKEPKPTVATQPLTGSKGTSWSRPLPHAHSMHAKFGGLPEGGRAI